MNDIALFIKPLLLTIVLESIASYIMGLRSLKEQILVALVNIITNPLLVYVSLFLMYHKGIQTGTVLTYLVLEPLVIFVEYLIYRSCLKNRNCFVLSLILNIISIIGGLLWQMLF